MMWDLVRSEELLFLQWPSTGRRLLIQSSRNLSAERTLVFSTSTQPSVPNFVDERAIANLQYLSGFPPIPLIVSQRLQNQTALHLPDRIFGHMFQGDGSPPGGVIIHCRGALSWLPLRRRFVRTD
jgi:hypothetical protein